MTTIKVEASTRDGLRALAQRQGLSMDDALKKLLEKAERDQHFADVNAAMAVNPPDDSYFQELRDWESDAWN